MSRTLVKICGIRSQAALDAAVSAGADYIGLVHYEPSPRHVSLPEARALRDMLPSHVKSVLLLVSMEAQETARAIHAVQPDVVQFHGAETPEWVGALRAAPQLQFEVWKAVGVKDAVGLERAQRYAGAVDRLLYDAPAGKLPGGQGLALDWSLLAGHSHQCEWGLAGGLTPENVGEAIRQTGATLVDTSSGVESAPGEKDVDKIRSFCQAARSA